MDDRERADGYLKGAFGDTEPTTAAIRNIPGAWAVFNQVRHTLPCFVAAVRREERERCAQVAERPYGVMVHGLGERGARDYERRSIAAAIRALTEEDR